MTQLAHTTLAAPLATENPYVSGRGLLCCSGRLGLNDNILCFNLPYIAIFLTLPEFSCFEYIRKI
jgi:hypothetical protein